MYAERVYPLNQDVESSCVPVFWTSSVSSDCWVGLSCWMSSRSQPIHQRFTVDSRSHGCGSDRAESVFRFFSGDSQSSSSLESDSSSSAVGNWKCRWPLAVLSRGIVGWRLSREWVTTWAWFFKTHLRQKSVEPDSIDAVIVGVEGQIRVNNWVGVVWRSRRGEGVPYMHCTIIIAGNYVTTRTITQHHSEWALNYVEGRLTRG